MAAKGAGGVANISCNPRAGATGSVMMPDTNGGGVALAAPSEAAAGFMLCCGDVMPPPPGITAPVPPPSPRIYAIMPQDCGTACPV